MTDIGKKRAKKAAKRKKVRASHMRWYGESCWAQRRFEEIEARRSRAKGPR